MAITENVQKLGAEAINIEAIFSKINYQEDKRIKENRTSAKKIIACKAK